MSLGSNTKLILGIVATSLLVLFAGLFLTTRPEKIYEKSLLIPEKVIAKGKIDSKVYLVEFSDFQCPACKAFKPVVDEIIKKYGNDIVFVYRHFPLPQHTYAEYSALAFESANQQGQAWEIYEYLFANQNNLSENSINNWAKENGLNYDQFISDINSKELESKVERDINDAKLTGVNSTPTFFLNGRKLKLQSSQDLMIAVENEINKNK